MSATAHTYGSTCHLTRIPELPSIDENEHDDSPPLRAQFFYTSGLPIDDPLSAVPPPADSSAKSYNHPPRPFSAYDNTALEEAWCSLSSGADHKYHQKLRNSRLKPLTKSQTDRRTTIIYELVTKHILKHELEEKTSLKKSGKAEINSRQKGKSRIGDNRVGSATTQPSGLGVGCECCHECQEGSCAAASSQSTSTKQDGSEAQYSLDQRDEPAVHICCSELAKDVKSAQPVFSGVLKRHESKIHQELLIRDVMSKISKATHHLEHDQDSAAESRGLAQGDATDEFPFVTETKSETKKFKGIKSPGFSSPALTPQRSISNMALHEGTKEAQQVTDVQNQPRPSESETSNAVDQTKRKPIAGTSSKHPLSLDQTVNEPLVVPGNVEAGTTGAPFQRAPSRSNSPAPLSREQPSHEEVLTTNIKQSKEPTTVYVQRCKASRRRSRNGHDIEIPVGVSRLHNVKLPQLQMNPIYWSPVHDVAAVTRGTWFYKETMYPVEAPVANQLETGYRDLRPWSQTWRDELNSAVKVGAAGEEKVSHRLWPEDTGSKPAHSISQGDGQGGVSSPVDYATDSYCAARCFHREVAATGSVELPIPHEKPPPTVTAEVVKRYPNSHVIYKNAHDAFILKPSLQPSQYFGRRPLAKIKKNIIVGIPVVRGFDWMVWDRLHPSKKSAVAKVAEEMAPVADSADTGIKSSCPACRLEQDRPKVTDLVLVIHGIGQKLSERMESFHFTHAVNTFRRSVNVELANEAVQKVLRGDLGGVMVLPVNWRQHLSFEEGGPAKAGDEIKERLEDDFNLKDITPHTIPAVRNLISDVLLDIPYYLSQHKPKMVEALITEANRVYRLWCKNNPEFQDTGRIHLIAHSLGSAMALDVLSKQPTLVPKVDLTKNKVQKKHFEFNTTNLFFAGSPAGFFLLLDKGKLLPRYGRHKPDADIGDDNVESVTGKAGTFGCLAVDNLYNVMHYNDPIAYRLNATIDPLYAASLKVAEVPSSTSTWLETFGNAFRALTPGVSTTAGLPVGQLAAKPMTVRLPSQLEMDVHDFTREEIAEKKFYLLNDNGQIDYFLATGGGPLEIQYLNMLGAHSSYWTSPDFIRMLVTEVGRRPGKTNTLPNMKAVKAVHKKK